MKQKAKKKDLGWSANHSHDYGGGRPKGVDGGSATPSS